MGEYAKYLAIVGAVVAVILLWQFLAAFHDWNRTQSCATGGGRNCAAAPVNLHR